MDAYMKKTKKENLKHAHKAPKASKHLAALDVSKAVPHPAEAGTTAEAIHAQGSRVLAALMTEVRLDQAQGGDGVTGEALTKVVKKVETLRADLIAEQKLAQEKRDTCIAEEHAANMELEQKYTEQQDYNITKQRQTKIIKDAEHEITTINASINDLVAELEVKKGERAEQHAEFRKSVQDQRET